VLGSIDAGPIGGTKRNARHVHDISLGLRFLNHADRGFFPTVSCEKWVEHASAISTQLSITLNTKLEYTRCLTNNNM